MKDKTILVTGANAGLGFETAQQLAQQNASLILLCRTLQKGEEAKAKLIASTGNKNIFVFAADLSSQKQIRKVCAEIHSQFEKIDVLFNNAGAVFSDFTLSEDGLEMTIATNHFSYFLFTNLLLDLIKKSDYARIINVSSHSHYGGNIAFESFREKRNYSILNAYQQSKLANVLFTYELAERLKHTRVTVNALHPGRVKTFIGNKGGKWYHSLGWSMIKIISSVNVQQGARTHVFLASSSEVNGVSGKYFSNCKPKTSSVISYDKTLAKKLWEETKKGIGY